MTKVRLQKRIGQKRRAAGWILLILGIFVVTIWVWSNYWRRELFVWTPSSESELSLLAGRLRLIIRQPHPAPDPQVELGAAIKEKLVPWRRRGWFCQWLPVIEARADRWETQAAIALWPIPILLCIPAALFLRSAACARRRATSRACSTCGYSLAGLAPGSICPECGKTG